MIAVSTQLSIISTFPTHRYTVHTHRIYTHGTVPVSIGQTHQAAEMMKFVLFAALCVLGKTDLTLTPLRLLTAGQMPTGGQ